MILEALGSVLLGLALSWAAQRRLPDRLPTQRVVYPAGTLGALFGAYLTHTALGSGHLLGTLLGAAFVAAVTLSLLIRPTTRRLRRSAAV
ncbi:hypothetical protein [Streptomyces marianii]|uniref:Integral membrane protein n=1 Tax=Streptomyces marianii TaxID=1817406 RepID=A0A5R9EH72_9ACTN|nr:hypothetical protein [Streptomyces marianii]TLQ48179.1 hypothetical protein FEF34_12880 [Streptomyces marianii]